jgi:hypothetical protein
VRLGPSTPGDYVRARVLVPQNPGVTAMTVWELTLAIITPCQEQVLLEEHEGCYDEFGEV